MDCGESQPQEPQASLGSCTCEHCCRTHWDLLWFVCGWTYCTSSHHWSKARCESALLTWTLDSKRNDFPIKGAAANYCSQKAARANREDLRYIELRPVMALSDVKETKSISYSTMEDLSEVLKEATKEVHQQAEDTEFMRNFQKGQVSLNEFKLVMSSLYFVYAALEEEIQHNKDNPVFSPLYFPLELHRKAALEDDLKYFYGPLWKEKIICPQSTKKYVERLHHIGQKEPELLVAHAYTRYLGDLSGGQVLKKIAQKALELPLTGEGLAFFTFDNVTNATKFKQLYRSRMNSIDMDSAMKKRISEEAKTAFLLNIKVFEELQTLTRQNATTVGAYKTVKGGSSPWINTSENTSFNLLYRWAAIGGCVLLAIMGLYIL